MNATTQRGRALALAIQRRTGGSHQRDALIGEPIATVVEALVHPTEELASVRLGKLFVPRRQSAGPIPGVGIAALNRIFLQLLEDHPRGRQLWHTELRLRDLTETERRRLVRALVKRAPKSWSESADPKGAGA